MSKAKYFTRFTVIPFICGFVTVWSLIQLSGYLSQTEKSVINGEAQLWCHMSDGYRLIDPSLVKYQIDDTWVFTNGSAKACEVK